MHIFGHLVPHLSIGYLQRSRHRVNEVYHYEPIPHPRPYPFLPGDSSIAVLIYLQKPDFYATCSNRNQIIYVFLQNFTIFLLLDNERWFLDQVASLLTADSLIVHVLAYSCIDNLGGQYLNPTIYR